MARCGCQGASCSCVVTGAGGVSVSGAGSVANPYVINSSIALGVADTSTIDMILSGSGASGDPYAISAVANIELDELSDVDTTGGTTGQVLAKQADGTYKLAPPSTASPGAITVGNGLQGDGSGGNPLAVKLAPSSGLISDGTGLHLEGGGAWASYATTWSALTTAPTLGNGSIVSRYTNVGKTYTVSIHLSMGSTTKRGVGAWGFTLPAAPAADRIQVLQAFVGTTSSGFYVGTARVYAGKIDRVFLATSTAASELSHSVPTTMTGSSYVAITGTYEAA